MAEAKQEVDYSEQVCTECGGIGMSAEHVINVETGMDKGYVGECNECGAVHDCGEYTSEGTGEVHKFGVVGTPKP